MLFERREWVIAAGWECVNPTGETYNALRITSAAGLSMELASLARNLQSNERSMRRNEYRFRA